MKKIYKIFLIFIIFIFTSTYSLAQTTSVSATITDSDNFTWVNAQWSVVFTPNPSFPNTNQYTINGVNLTSTTYSSYLNQKGLTNSSGQLSVTLLDNTIIQPAGSNWTFTIKSDTSAAATAYQPVQIFGGSQDLTTFLSSQSIVPRFPATPGAYGYGDIELNTVPFPGGQYFNTTTLFPRFWNGSVWGNLAGAIGITSINGYQGAVTFTGAVTCTGSPLVCNFTGGSSGGGFNLNVSEMGALSSGASPTLTHTNRYIVPVGQTTAQINALISTTPYGTFEFQNGDSVLNSFTNPGWTAQITHDGIYFVHSTMNWDGMGVINDGRVIIGNLTSGTNAIHITNTNGSQLFTINDIGKVVWATGIVGGIQTAFEPQISTVSGPNDATLTVNAPFNATGIGMYLGTDNTSNIQAANNFASFYSNGYAPAALLTMSAGTVLTHSQTLVGNNFRGAGVITNFVNAPGESLFVAPDPNVSSINQGSNLHISDIAITLNATIDPTQPWQIINQGGTTSINPQYWPAYKVTVESNVPTAAQWIIGSGPNNGGAINGIATTNNTTTICVPSASVSFPSNINTPQIIFPYLSTLFETTVASGGGSCAGGFTGFTLAASVPVTGTQQEWFAGTNIQHTTVDFPASPTFPFTLTVANSIAPSPSSEQGAAPYGLIKIGPRSCVYNGYSKTSPYSYNITSCTGTSTDASVGSFIAPLNPFQPTHPWPVTPTLNSNDTTPAATAEYYPGHNIGVAAFAFPQASGLSGAQSQGWNQSKIENIYITGAPTNNSACFYMVGTPYSTIFDNIKCINTVYGIIQATPALETHNYLAGQPTAFNMRWSSITVKANYIADFINSQASLMEDWDTYAGFGGSPQGAGIFTTSSWDDQTGGALEGVYNNTWYNIFTEPEGTNTSFEPLFELDGSSNIIHNWNQGGLGEVYIGGGNWHFLGGQFNNNGGPPIINYGDGTTFDYVGRIGSDPVGNTYGVNQFITWGPRTRAYGRVAGLTGPYGNLAYGNNRTLYDGQTNETFNTGNLTAPYPYSASGFITPDEYGFPGIDPAPMSTLWTFDSTAPITQSYASCILGSSPGFSYCTPWRFNGTAIPIGPGQRLVPGKYMFYGEFKSGLSSSNFSLDILGINGPCGGFTNISGPYSIGTTNTWPVGTNVFSKVVDLTSFSGCDLQLAYESNGTADTIYNAFIDWAPLPENFNVQQVTIQGTGAPTITNSNGAETWQTITPTNSTCGTTWANGTIWHNLNGTAAGVNRFYICDSATTTWNAKF